MTIPIAVLIAGLILYFGCSRPRASAWPGAQVAECGRIMFWTGLFFVVAASAGVRLF